MVECEFYRQKSLISDLVVLIDTWWNVNNQVVCASSAGSMVLIDTWWNVNRKNAEIP